MSYNKMENKEKDNKSIALSSKKELEKKKDKQENSFLKYPKMFLQFLRDAKTELKKVKWPTRKELFASTAIVLVFMLLIGIFLGLIDLVLVKLIQLII